jgi:hypothetical protein
MPLAIAAIGMMSLTLLACQHAMEKLIGVDPDGRCASGMEAVGPVGCLPAAANHPSGGLETAAPAAAMADVMPGPFAQGLADRKVYET